MIIDLSYHKGQLDLQAIRASGVIANIHKASDGFFMPTDLQGNYSFPNHIDVSFRMYWRSFKNIFDWRGAYHFLRVDDEVAAKKGRPASIEQIDLFVNVLEEEGLEPEDYVVLDVEQLSSEIDYLSHKQIGDRVKQAVIRLEQKIGKKPMIYTGAWWWEMFHDGFDNDFFLQYPFWLSHYWPIENNIIKGSGTKFYIRDNRVFPRAWLDNLEDRIAYCRVPMLDGQPTINPNHVYLWQYSEEGKIPGTNGKNIDLNLEIIPESEWVLARPAGPPPVKPPIQIPGDGIHKPSPITVQAVGSLIEYANSDNWSSEKIKLMVDSAIKL